MQKHYNQKCKAPCNTMEVKSRLMRTIEHNWNGIKVIFDPTVRLSRSKPTMDLVTLFSNIGGILGLTLGYSILQLFETIQLLFQRFWKGFLISQFKMKCNAGWFLISLEDKTWEYFRILFGLIYGHFDIHYV